MNAEINNNKQSIQEEEWAEYFKKFEWLENAPIPQKQENKNILLRNLFFSMFFPYSVNLKKEPSKSINLFERKLYMYFVSLEEEKMFLHVDGKEEEKQIIEKVQKTYPFAQIYNPKKVVFILEIKDLYDVDKHVKMFMHMFGVNNTRGGSYCDVILSDDEINCIEKEKAITQIDFYDS